MHEISREEAQFEKSKKKATVLFVNNQTTIYSTQLVSSYPVCTFCLIHNYPRAFTSSYHWKTNSRSGLKADLNQKKKTVTLSTK